MGAGDLIFSGKGSLWGLQGAALRGFQLLFTGLEYLKRSEKFQTAFPGSIHTENDFGRIQW